MSFNLFGANIILFILGIIATVTNACSFFYIRKTFNVKICLYFLLAIDSCVSCLACLITASIFGIYRLIDESYDESYRYRDCLILTSLGTPALFYLQPPINFAISFIRYKTWTSKDPNAGWKPQKTLLLWTNFCMALYLAYYETLVVLNGELDLKMFNSFNVCLHQDKAPANNRKLIGITLLLPTFLVLMLTNFLDLQR